MPRAKAANPKKMPTSWPQHLGRSLCASFARVGLTHGGVLALVLAWALLGSGAVSQLHEQTHDHASHAAQPAAALANHVPQADGDNHAAHTNHCPSDATSHTDTTPTEPANPATPSSEQDGCWLCHSLHMWAAVVVLVFLCLFRLGPSPTWAWPTLPSLGRLHAPTVWVRGPPLV